MKVLKFFLLEKSSKDILYSYSQHSNFYTFKQAARKTASEEHGITTEGTDSLLLTSLAWKERRNVVDVTLRAQQNEAETFPVTMSAHSVT